MKRKNIALLMITAILMMGCSSFYDTYKPLYQVKPEKKKLEEGL